jgi:hypothetical protein
MNPCQSGKRPFRSHHDAKVAARQLGGHSSDYRCRYCGHYHITHYPRRVSKAIGLLIRELTV